MRTMESIQFRCCRPLGRTLAGQLLELFHKEALSSGIHMTLWLDEELPGDLRVHLENNRREDADSSLGHLGMRIEQVLEKQGLVSRRRLIEAAENE